MEEEIREVKDSGGLRIMLFLLTFLVSSDVWPIFLALYGAVGVLHVVWYVVVKKTKLHQEIFLSELFLIEIAWPAMDLLILSYAIFDWVE